MKEAKYEKRYERMKWQGREYERGLGMSYDIQITKRAWVQEKGGMWKRFMKVKHQIGAKYERGGMWEVLWQSHTK
jgi:hypothetical protein